MEPLLRKCVRCGLEAHSDEDLLVFRKQSRSKYGRQNLCKSCASENAIMRVTETPTGSTVYGVERQRDY